MLLGSKDVIFCKQMKPYLLASQSIHSAYLYLTTWTSNVNTLDEHAKFNEMGGIIVTVIPPPQMLGSVKKILLHECQTIDTWY